MLLGLPNSPPRCCPRTGVSGRERLHDRRERREAGLVGDEQRPVARGGAHPVRKTVALAEVSGAADEQAIATDADLEPALAPPRRRRAGNGGAPRGDGSRARPSAGCRARVGRRRGACAAGRAPAPARGARAPRHGGGGARLLEAPRHGRVGMKVGAPPGPGGRTLTGQMAPPVPQHKAP